MNADSPLFAPIDSLTDPLFQTNSCAFLPKLYGIWKTTTAIDFAKLPQSFVLKTNHDCGGVVIVPNKDAFLADKKVFDAAMTKLAAHLKTNFYSFYKEWHYKDIEPRLFAEELLGFDNTNADSVKYHSPNNYRIFTFPNKKMFIQVDDADYATSHKRWFYDENWVFQQFSYNMPVLNDAIEKPPQLETMKKMAKLLAYNYTRVDLYEINAQIFVGELTMTPVGGTARFTPPEWDKKLGELWT